MAIQTTIRVTSDAFGQGERIAKRYTGDGEDISPPISWSEVPEGTRQLALICDDPDAPTEQPWVHWVLYQIPPDMMSLPEGVPNEEKLENPPGALQGMNSWTSGRTLGYRGPAPPPGHGVHHYHFKLYALDTPLNLEPGLDKNVLLQAISGHILGMGELIGTYER